MKDVLNKAVHEVRKTDGHLDRMIDVLEDRGIITNSARFKNLLEVKFDHAKNRCGSRGGVKLNHRPPTTYGEIVRPTMSIGLVACYKAAAHHGKFREYTSYQNDVVIGTIETDDPAQVVLGHVAHELTHVVQYCEAYKDRLKVRLTGDGLPKNDKPHGVLFQYIYRILRADYVNPVVFGTRMMERVEREPVSQKPHPIFDIETRVAAAKKNKSVKPKVYRNRAALVRAMIDDGLSNVEIIREAVDAFPKVTTGNKEVNWYRWEMKRKAAEAEA